MCSCAENKTHACSAAHTRVYASQPLKALRVQGYQQSEDGWCLLSFEARFPFPSCLMELRGKFLIKGFNFKKMGNGVHWPHLCSSLGQDRRLGTSTTKGVGGEGTWVVFVQSDSVDQELIKAFVDY